MTRQAAYRLQQLAAGKCARGCQRARWGMRTMCRLCTLRMAIARKRRYAAAADARRERTAA